MTATTTEYRLVDVVTSEEQLRFRVTDDLDERGRRPMGTSMSTTSSTLTRALLLRSWRSTRRPMFQSSCPAWSTRLMRLCVPSEGRRGRRASLATERCAGN